MIFSWHSFFSGMGGILNIDICFTPIFALARCAGIHISDLISSHAYWIDESCVLISLIPMHVKEV